MCMYMYNMCYNHCCICCVWPPARPAAPAAGRSRLSAARPARPETLSNWYKILVNSLKYLEIFRNN